jgi:hypothetical protein
MRKMNNRNIVTFPARKKKTAPTGRVIPTVTDWLRLYAGFTDEQRVRYYWLGQCGLAANALRAGGEGNDEGA